MWATQARIVQRHLDESELRLIDDFFGTQRLAEDSSNFRLWVNMLTLDADPRVVRKAEPLYYAVSYKFVKSTTRLTHLPPISGIVRA